MRIVAFGTYRLWEQPRVQVLFEGLREHGHELVEVNVPLQVDTAERVKAARQPLRAPLVAARVARAWRELWRQAKVCISTRLISTSASMCPRRAYHRSRSRIRFPRTIPRSSHHPPRDIKRT